MKTKSVRLHFIKLILSLSLILLLPFAACMDDPEESEEFKACFSMDLKSSKDGLSSSEMRSKLDNAGVTLDVILTSISYDSSSKTSYAESADSPEKRISLADVSGIDDTIDDTTDQLSDLSFPEGEMCLNDFLEKIGSSREELGVTGTDILRTFLEAQESLLGKTFIVDCVARDSLTDIADRIELGIIGGGSDSTTDSGIPEGSIPDRIIDIIHDDNIDQEEDAPAPEYVILFDATGSMGDDQEEVAKHFKGITAEIKKYNGRLAIAWYKDNQSCDDPWYGVSKKGLQDAGDAENALQDCYNLISVQGGCDIPESMYDGVWHTVNQMNWSDGSRRKIIAITDAPSK